jgi:hypothetical protein
MMGHASRRRGSETFIPGNLVPPRIGDEDGGVGVIVIGYKDDGACRMHLLGDMVHHALVDRKRLVADCGSSHADLEGSAPGYRGGVPDVDIGNNHADVRKRLIPRKQSKLGQIVDARLLKVREKRGVVDVSLWIQIAIADFEGMKELELHRGRLYRWDLEVRPSGRRNSTGHSTTAGAAEERSLQRRAEFSAGYNHRCDACSAMGP